MMLAKPLTALLLLALASPAIAQQKPAPAIEPGMIIVKCPPTFRRVPARADLEIDGAPFILWGGTGTLSSIQLWLNGESARCIYARTDDVLDTSSRMRCKPGPSQSKGAQWREEAPGVMRCTPVDQCDFACRPR